MTTEASGQNESKSGIKPRVLSGVQPSGALHIGNYFGAIKQHIELQHQFPGEAFYFIADYHALTTTQDPALLQAAESYALMVLENGRLVRQLTSSIGELSASRARIVAVTDEARRRIERDVHDGAGGDGDLFCLEHVAVEDVGAVAVEGDGERGHEAVEVARAGERTASQDAEDLGAQLPRRER